MRNISLNDDSGALAPLWDLSIWQRRAEFMHDALRGLSAPQKYLPPKYFYDRTGSALFEKITELPEYYPTRSELAILDRHGAAIAAQFPKRAALVEFGAGSSRKIRELIKCRVDLTAYVPVDLSAQFLLAEAAGMRRDFPHLQVFPLIEDFTRIFALPIALAQTPVIGFFPGSTIGNMDHADAVRFLQRAAATLGEDCLFIVGVDLVKYKKRLIAAYDDSAGVTASFNLNLLARLNRELGTNFDPTQFRHVIRYDDARERIEMHLQSLRPQTVSLCGTSFEFTKDETIHTESCHKYTLHSFAALARRAGWKVSDVFLDSERNFSVQLLRPALNL